MDANDVVRDDGGSRFVAEQGGEQAELTYRRQGDRLLLDHTGVPEALSGEGVGSALVQAMVAWASGEHLTLVPHCPFVRGWLERHPDDLGGLEVDWPAA